jgi:pantoate kinase
MTVGRAHVGGHITLLFSIQASSPNALEQGSRGSGLSISHGVDIIATATAGGEGRVNLVGDAPDELLFVTVVEELSVLLPEVANTDWNIEHRAELPTSQGFGLSASAALATALAMQRALGEQENEVARAVHCAHMVERRLSGGLGDVAAIHAGGVELRIEAGCPSFEDGLGGPGAVLSWYRDIPMVICWRATASRHTSGYIDDENWKSRISESGELALKPLFAATWDANSWHALLDASADFAADSGLLGDANRHELLLMVGGALASCALIDAGLISRLCMLGESAVIFPSDLAGECPEGWQQRLVDALQARGLGAFATAASSNPLNL